MASKKDRVKQVWHLFAGLLILMHGFASFEENDFKSAGGYIGVALLALVVAGVHKYIDRSFNNADVAFFLLEAVTLSYSAWDYGEEDKKVLSYFIGAAAILFFIMAIVSLISTDEHGRKRSRKHHHRRRSNPSTGNEI